MRFRRLLLLVLAFLGAQMLALAEPPLSGGAADGEKPVNVNELLDFAKTFIGTKYRSAGKSPGGFDCSGFTSYVFRQYGISLNSSSATQYGQGTEIKQSQLRPGDLVFFTGRNASSGKVGHVGIITEVQDNGLTFRFIHASVGKGVTLDRFPDDYYYVKRLVGFRRLDGLGIPHEVLDLPALDFEKIWFGRRIASTTSVTWFLIQ